MTPAAVTERRTEQTTDKTAIRPFRFEAPEAELIEMRRRITATKLSETERGFRGNVLEAAILSLAAHPNAPLQAQVDARIQQLIQAQGTGNGGFEVAAAYFNTTGKRELLDQAIRSADALYDAFRADNPPFSGGERDAINCVQLYRVTHDRKHLDLAKHYLDIRGLPNSVNRSRHNQSYRPVVYCAEWPEVEGGRVLDLLLDEAVALEPSPGSGVHDGVVVIDAEARTVRSAASPNRTITLIPYSHWANRGPGQMSVWLSTAIYAPGDIGPAGGFIFYENPNYETDGWRFLEAAPFDQSAGATCGCFRRAIAGARGTAVGTGQQNTLDMLAACSEPGTAAALCANLSINGVRGWFLPSRDELTLMYRNLKAAGAGDFRDGGVADNFTYWTSSQQTADMAAHIDFADLGRLHGDDKDFPRRVRAVRAI